VKTTIPTIPTTTNSKNNNDNNKHQQPQQQLQARKNIVAIINPRQGKNHILKSAT